MTSLSEAIQDRKNSCSFVGSCLVSNVSRHVRFTHRTYQQPHGGEQDEVILSLDEVVAWLEAGLLDPREGETEEPFHVGRWRRSIGREAPASKWAGSAQLVVCPCRATLKPLCGSNESFSHNFETGESDVCCGYVFFGAELGRLCCQ